MWCSVPTKQSSDGGIESFTGDGWRVRHSEAVQPRVNQAWLVTWTPTEPSKTVQFWAQTLTVIITESTYLQVRYLVT